MTKRTLESLSGLHPKFRAQVETFLAQIQPVLAAHQVRAEVISGLRSGGQQEWLYASGRTRPGPIVTKARPWQSWHNYGLAIDLGLFQDKVYLDEKNPRLADKVYRALAPVAEAMGLEWAGRWKSFTETPHFQNRFGIPNPAEAKRRLDLAGGDIAKLALP